MSDTKTTTMALLPPPIFWRALLVLLNESVVFYDADFIGHRSSAIWELSVKDSIEIVERVLNEAIRGGMLRCGQTVT